MTDPAELRPPSGPVERSRRRERNHGLDTRRLRNIRLITFGVLALPLLALGLLMLKFVSMPLTQAWQGAAYEDGRHPAAIERLAPLWPANWFEPYLPHLTKGTNLLQEGKDSEAETELRTALEAWENGKDLNKPLHAECKIRNNLALSIERQAMREGDAQARADRLYEAEVIIAPCAGGGGGGGGDGQGDPSEGEGEGEGQGQGEGSPNEDQGTTGENSDRIEEERKQADEEAGNDPADRPDPKEDGDTGGEGEPGQGNAPPDPGDPTKGDPEGTEDPQEQPDSGTDPEQQKDQDELEQRNRDANRGEGQETPSGERDEGTPPW